MYEQELRQMQRAAKAGKVRFVPHAVRELALDHLSPDDAVNCILTGEIVRDQYDPKYQQMKYVIYGDSLSHDEIAVVARWDDDSKVVVITVFRLRVGNYE
ncbi:MAG: DUF4258 domain-containing protein [Acidobacteria bacterium]|nr:DUF4258 domain-containing protein [Acidobacteriota bacterium]